MFQGESSDECPNSTTVDSEGLHSCEKCNILHYLLYPESTNLTPVTDNYESKMADQKTEDLILSLDMTDMDIEQPDRLGPLG